MQIERTPESWERFHFCGGCYSRSKPEDSDIHHEKYFFGWYEKFYFDCPVCGKMIEISDGEFSPLMRARIRKGEFMTLASQIRQLRDDTGLGVMECKRALNESDGDFDAAKKLAISRASAKVKPNRETSFGAVSTYSHNDRIASLVEVNCETDFVAKMPEFLHLANLIAQHIVGADPESIDDLLSQPYIKNTKITVKDLITEFQGKCGENIKIGRFSRYDVGSRFTAV